MFNFFKRRRNKRFNQESHDKAKENQTVSEKKLDLKMMKQRWILNKSSIFII